MRKKAATTPRTRINPMRNPTAVLCALLSVGALLWAGPQQGKDQEQHWIAVLRSDSPKAQKAIACKYLAIYGTEKAVPALEPFLCDPELSSWARIAFEVIPGPEADSALRAALNKTKGRLLVGIINSIGVRRDPLAVPELIKILEAGNPEAAAAAAAALGHIGTQSAVEALKKILGKRTERAVRSAAAEGCILCAEKLLREGLKKEAAALYDFVRRSDVPKQRVVEATRGAILARGSEGVELLGQNLTSPDKAMFLLALTVSRELPGPQVTRALAKALPGAPPGRQARLLLALADRKDSAALPALLQAATGGPKTVRLTALEVLPEIGDQSCVEKLLGLAVDSDSDIAAAAKKALQNLKGRGVDSELLSRLKNAKGAMREVLIELAGMRAIAEANDILKAACRDPEARVRQKAFRALGLAAAPKDLDFLIRNVVNPEHPEDFDAAQAALCTACLRMPDREDCAGKLSEALQSLPVSAKAALRKKRWDPATRSWRWVPVSVGGTLLEILGALGGKQALETVSEAARSPEGELRETAIAVLSRWLGPEAAPELIAAARAARSPTARMRALQGFVKLLGAFKLPENQLVSLCREAFKIAGSPAEKTLIIRALQKRPSLGALRLLIEAARDSDLKKQAAGAALAVAQKIGGGKAQVQELLKLIGQKPVRVEIISAEYGAGDKFVDVTRILRRYVRDLPVIVLPSTSYNASLGGDPVPGVVKELRIRYKINGKEGRVVLPENAPVILPAP